MKRVVEAALKYNRTFDNFGRAVAVRYVRPVFNCLFPHYCGPEYEHDGIINRIEGRGYDAASLENAYQRSEILTAARTIRNFKLRSEEN